MLDQKESRADFRYVPAVKDLKDAMYIPKDLDLLAKCVGNYIDEPKGKTLESGKSVRSAKG